METSKVRHDQNLSLQLIGAKTTKERRRRRNKLCVRVCGGGGVILHKFLKIPKLSRRLAGVEKKNY